MRPDEAALKLRQHSNTIFQILQRNGQPGYFPLNENHWSNLLAWLLTHRDHESLSHSLLETIAPGWGTLQTWSVDREVEYITENQKRQIDIQITDDSGLRLFIEVKIDPTYQDRQQIADQLSLLQNDECFVILAPLDLSSFLAEINASCECHASTKAITWHSLTKWCHDQKDHDEVTALERVVLDGIESHWGNSMTAPFEHLVQIIIKEQGWTTFYPDDFKEVFLERFPEVWGDWVAEKPEVGNGNPHMYLTTCLAMLANRKKGFRLVRTGNSRPPKQVNWGYPTIYELGMQQDAE